MHWRVVRHAAVVPVRRCCKPASAVTLPQGPPILRRMRPRPPTPPRSAAARIPRSPDRRSPPRVVGESRGAKTRPALRCPESRRARRRQRPAVKETLSPPGRRFTARVSKRPRGQARCPFASAIQLLRLRSVEANADANPVVRSAPRCGVHRGGRRARHGRRGMGVQVERRLL